MLTSLTTVIASTSFSSMLNQSRSMSFQSAAYPHRPLSPLCIQSSSMWEFPLPWCQIMIHTLSPTNSKLFCLTTSLRMYAHPWVIISQMVWWNVSSKNLRSISKSVMQLARPTFCALLPHFAYIITPPWWLTGLFLIVLCSSMSCKLACQLNVLKRDQPHAPERVFVRVEHQKPVPGFVPAKVRTNTSLDSHRQLVHNANVMARQQTREDKFNEQDAEPPEEIPAPSPPSAETAAAACVSPTLQCRAQNRHPLEHYSFTGAQDTSI